MAIVIVAFVVIAGLRRAGGRTGGWDSPPGSTAYFKCFLDGNRELQGRFVSVIVIVIAGIVIIIITDIVIGAAVDEEVR